MVATPLIVKVKPCFHYASAGWSNDRCSLNSIDYVCKVLTLQRKCVWLSMCWSFCTVIMLRKMPQLISTFCVRICQIVMLLTLQSVPLPVIKAADLLEVFLAVVSANGREDSNTHDNNPKASSGSFILQTLRRTRVAVSQFIDSIMEAMLDVINGFLGLADKSLHAIGDPEGDPFNRTVKYCTVLAVLVLALVVVKRSSTVAQNASKVE